MFGEHFVSEVYGYSFEGIPSTEPDVGDEECTEEPGLYEFRDMLLPENATESLNISRCPKYHWYVQALSIIYLFGVAVLLMNLLIAMFSHTFEEVHKDTTMWCWQRYQVVSEYYRRNSLMPPLNLFIALLRSSQRAVAKIWYNQAKYKQFKLELELKQKPMHVDKDTFFDQFYPPAEWKWPISDYRTRILEASDNILRQALFKYNRRITNGNIHENNDKANEANIKLATELIQAMEVNAKLEMKLCNLKNYNKWLRSGATTTVQMNAKNIQPTPRITCSMSVRDKLSSVYDNLDYTFGSLVLLRNALRQLTGTQKSTKVVLQTLQRKKSSSWSKRKSVIEIVIQDSMSIPNNMLGDELMNKNFENCRQLWNGTESSETTEQRRSSVQKYDGTCLWRGMLLGIIRLNANGEDGKDRSKLVRNVNLLTLGTLHFVTLQKYNNRFRVEKNLACRKIS